MSVRGDLCCSVPSTSKKKIKKSKKTEKGKKDKEENGYEDMNLKYFVGISSKEFGFGGGEDAVGFKRRYDEYLLLC